MTNTIDLSFKPTQKSTMTLSNLDVHYLVQEAKALEGEFLQKAFGQSGTFRFKFRHVDWVFHLPETAFLTRTPPHFAEHPTSFVMLLRKRLTGRLQAATQVGFDRIVQLQFPDVSVVIELFGDGNLLLLDQVGFILKPWKSEEFSSRKLQSGQKYKPPPQDKAHPAEWTPVLLDGLAGPIIAALSKTVNLSPFYLEEALVRAGVDKKKPANRLTTADKENIQAALKGLINEPLSPRVYYQDEKPLHAAPFAVQSLAHLESQPAATFSDALQAVFQQTVAVKQAEQVQIAPQIADSRKAAVLEKQRASLESFEHRAQEAQKKAEWIYQHFALIEQLRQHSDSHDDTIRPFLQGVSFKKKRHKIEIEVPDTP